MALIGSGIGSVTIYGCDKPRESRQEPEQVPLAPQPSAAPVETKVSATDLVTQSYALGDQLIAGEITDAQWQDGISRILSSVDVEQLMQALDVDALFSDVAPVDHGFQVAAFPERIAPMRDKHEIALFRFAKGRANPPHAHDNVVDAHMVLRGSFRFRHWDRISDTDKYLVVRPTFDEVIGAGQYTTLSSANNNLHWHHAESDGLLVGVKVVDWNPNMGTWKAHFVDPRNARKLEDGTEQLPRLDGRMTAMGIFG